MTTQKRLRCPFISRCPMFEEFRARKVLQMYQNHYCEGAFESCARHALASRGNMPAAMLLPDGTRMTPSDGL